MGLREEAERIRQLINAAEEVKVRVAIFGGPGAGKSSIINALLGREMAPVGVYTDTTTRATPYEWEGVILTDLPGYDTASFPREKYFATFDIPSFDLFLCVYDGKFRAPDTAFFRDLLRVGKKCLFVRNKSDSIRQRGKPIEDLKDEIVCDARVQTGSSTAEVIFTSCETLAGLDILASRIRDSLTEAQRERWTRTAKAYSKSLLEDKRETCERLVILSAGLSAANGINPIPGADVAVDAGVLVGLFTKIRHAYGLSDEKLASVAKYAPAIAPLANRAIEYATKEGVLLLLKRFVKKRTLKQISKYIPYVGQVISATLGFTLTYQAGTQYLDDCHNLALAVLEMELQLQVAEPTTGAAP